MVEYIIKEVIPKDGKMRSIHKEVLNRQCFIDSIEIDQRGWIRFRSTDPDSPLRLHTSPVLGWETFGENLDVKIETRNTTYILQRISPLP